MPESIISIRGASKSYASGGATVIALSRVDLDVPAGEFLTIVGPSGCGKSTLLYMLGGFLSPTEGMLFADGKRVERPGTDRGIVFQDYALFPWLNVFDNIAYGLEMKGVARRERNAMVERAIATIGLVGFEQRFPRELSGGMRQRVALARTFAYEPPILLLDEPFGALDSQTREIMQDELLRLWRNRGNTVVMVTHDVAEAVYLSDRVCVMSQRPGRIVDQFLVKLDHDLGREAVMLSAPYREMHDKVWLSVRRQAIAVDTR